MFLTILFCLIIVVVFFSPAKDPDRNFKFLLDKIRNNTTPELVNARERIIKSYLKKNKITAGQAAILFKELDKLYK